MSVTIVSTLPKPSQAKATENTASTSNEAPASGQDFASLLFGQLLPVVTETVTETTSDTTASQSDASTADSSNLLAALGLIPTEINPASKTSVSVLSGSNKTEKTSSEKLTALQTDAFQSDSKASIPTELVNAVAAETNEKAAKFAVPAAFIPRVENTQPKNASADSSANLNTAITPTANGNLNALSAAHETTVAVPTPIRDQHWANDFSQKVVWLATGDKQSAQMTLNPPQMGPIEISLSMDKGNATASFVSPNAEVRDAIETALPRLREMFASAGIQLGQTNVSSESFKQQSDSGAGQSSTNSSRNDNAILATSSVNSLPIRAFGSQHGNGLVNTFA